MHTTVKVRTFTVAKVQATPALKTEVIISSNSQRVAAATAQPGDAGLVWAPAAQPGDADLWGPAEAVVVAATLAGAAPRAPRLWWWLGFQSASLHRRCSEEQTQVPALPGLHGCGAGA